LEKHTFPPPGAPGDNSAMNDIATPGEIHLRRLDELAMNPFPVFHAFRR
jgi:hypothetical protein